MRLALFSLMLVVFALTTGEFVIVGILPDVAADLAVTVPDAGLLVTAYAAGMIVGGPTVTVLTARQPPKRLMIGLVAVAVAGNLASALAPNYPLLLASRALAGLVVATFFAVAISTAVSMAPEGRQGSAVARVTLGMNLGIVLGAPAGTFIGQSLGWRAPFVVIAVVSAAALLLVLRSVPDRPAATTGSVLGELRVLANRDVRWAIALTAVGNVGVVAVFSYLAPLLTEISGFSPIAVPVLLLVYGVGAVLGNLLGGRLADRVLMPSLSGLLAALAAVLVLLWLLGGDRTAAVALVFATGVLAFAIIPGMQTRVVTAAAGTAPTLAVAVNASGFQLATAFAGWLGGRIIDSGLGLGSIPLVGAALTVAGLTIAITVLVGDRRRTPVSAPGTRGHG